ncbi:hypothetical protein FA13DRAFT_1732047 [Coprinellus micaceus]|uniref:Uncharacterized protein n=1 Tax=Coprinellus micaceus TaxID=71717 RepID=A0A4Y7TDQ9_COPMI|nr:hypothetical protein FA13DRAFT_1732047 [Coprinellus micaceus]
MDSASLSLSEPVDSTIPQARSTPQGCVAWGRGSRRRLYYRTTSSLNRGTCFYSWTQFRGERRIVNEEGTQLTHEKMPSFRRGW